MVIVDFDNEFKKIFSKLDTTQKERVITQINKLEQYPEIGKPMMHDRKGTRELYVPPFRLSYAYLREENKIILLNLYHKDEQ